MEITVPDGAGGWQMYPLPLACSIIDNTNSNYGIQLQWWTLSYLNAAWGEIVAAGQGVEDAPAPVSGNTVIGTA